jgi:phage-related protein
MARGTDFGGVHSNTDLHLIQQSVDIQPAEPKLNMVDIPGADGSKDLTEKPGGRVVYKDRTLTWIFALYPGENWHDKHRQVSNALNGRRCKITLDDDPDHYYLGRLSVKKYNTDKAVRQITVVATCSPWMLKQELTIVTDTFNNANRHLVKLPNEKKPVIPAIELTHEASILWNDNEIIIPAGAYTSLDIELQEGENKLLVMFPGGTGTITVTYQEGSL